MTLTKVAVASVAVFFVSLTVARGDEPLDLKKTVERLKTIKDEAEKATLSLLSVDDEAVRKSIKVFEAAPESKEKVLAATTLSLAEASLASHSKNESKLSAEERLTLKKAQGYLNGLKKMSEQFEANLSPKDLVFVTQDNPDSIYRAMKRLTLLSQPICNPVAYQNLKKKFGANELAEKGQAVMLLAGLYEEPFISKYIERINQLLAQQKGKEGLAAYYSAAVQQYSSLAPDAERIAAEQNKLISTKVPANQLKPFVAKTAALSPACLGKLNIPFVKQQRRDILMDRGKYLLEGLRAQIANTGQRPENLDGVPLQEGHAIYGERRDPYGNDYLLQYSKNKVMLYSLGQGVNSPVRILVGTAVLNSH